MTPEQYERILPLKGLILSKAAGGNEAVQIIDLYKEMSGDQHFRVTCKACVEDMLNYMASSMESYERSKETA